MAFDPINIGLLPDDHTGDALRTAFAKINTIGTANAAALAQILGSVIVAGQVNSAGHLILTYGDGSVGDAGPVVGPVGVASATVNGAGHLILTPSVGTPLDAGSVVGAAGRGITSAAVNGSYRLILTYTDGSTQDVGLVRAANTIAGPTTSVANNIPLWNATDGTVLKDSGLQIGTAANNILQLGSDAKVPSGNLPSLVSGLTRSARTANVQLVAADKGSFIDITSGTFTQTFDTLANLAAGWWIYYGNSGTGVVTIPSSDGVTNWPVYPGEIRLFLNDGTTLRSKVVNPFYATFTASGTFVTPPGYSLFSGFIWGGGASGIAGGSGAVAALGGGGAAATPFHATPATLGASQPVTIGAGGVGSNSTTSATGGNSTLGAIATGYAGSIATNSISTANGLKTFTSGNAYDPFSGGVGTSGAGNGSSIYGAGAGAYTPAGGPNAPGTSVFGGSGGLGTLNGTAGNGNAPGGGGGGSYNSASGSGARGELRIWGVV